MNWVAPGVWFGVVGRSEEALVGTCWYLRANHHVLCSQENAHKRTMELGVWFASQISRHTTRAAMQPVPDEQPPDIDQRPEVDEPIPKSSNGMSTRHR